MGFLYIVFGSLIPIIGYSLLVLFKKFFYEVKIAHQEGYHVSTEDIGVIALIITTLLLTGSFIIRGIILLS